MYGTSFIAALSVTWNGTAVSGPLLIYHHEINVFAVLLNTNDTLACRTGAWHYPNATNVTLSSFFCQINLFGDRRVLFRTTDRSQSDASFNGLWTCRHNGHFTTAIPVGLYQRGQGELICSLPGIIIVFVQEVFLSMKYPSFPSSPPYSLPTPLPLF